jgi:hypothetical protein
MPRPRGIVNTPKRPHLKNDFFPGGMKLLFPFGWDGWQWYLIRSDDYWMTIIALLAVLLVYGIYWYHAKRKKLYNNEKKEFRWELTIP